MKDTWLRSIETIPGFERNADLSRFTTFRIGGPAEVLVKPETVAQVQQIAACVSTHAVPCTILGGGSNILISDAGIKGIVIVPSMKDIAITKERVRAGAGLGLQKFLQEMKKHQLSGLEQLVGIPGSLGGAIVGNAGTSKSWIEERIACIETVNLLDGHLCSYKRSEAGFEYRDSRFKKSGKEVVVYGTFSLQKDDAKKIEERMSAYLSKRTKQPTGNSSAGCVFRNPKEAPAGMIIDQLGLKGKKMGGAEISSEHGNFIVNTGNATAEDVIMLISYIKQQVRDKRGIQLQEEIIYLGF